MQVLLDDNPIAFEVERGWNEGFVSAKIDGHLVRFEFPKDRDSIDFLITVGGRMRKVRITRAPAAIT